jgi:Cu(I)/Ag(I) efflux system membrane fusion protein
MKKSSLTMIVALVLLAGIIIGHYSTRFYSSFVKPEKKPLYWIDAMEPQIHYPGPGKSRMGMEMVPVYPEEGKASDSPGAVRISPAVVNNLGVRIALVSQGTLARNIETVGYIEPNENKIGHVHTYAEGWIKKLIVKAVGEPVKAGQLLLQFYSPQLVNAQQEFLIALDSNNQSLIEASYKRLEAYHISKQQIDRLKQTRKPSQLIDVYAPQDGIISALKVREGMHVMPETEIMSLDDLSTIWMIAQVYEDQSEWVKVGEKVEASLPPYPGKVWKGEIDYIYPQVDPMTRTLKVRVRFENPDGLLKPNMYASIKLIRESKTNVLLIPTEALIRTSKGDHVVVELANGGFDARPVIVGIETSDKVEILSGLKAGEKVVTSGQFLIDSESNLKSGFERLESQKEGN